MHSKGALLVGVALVAAACSGGDDDSTGTTEAAAASPRSSTAGSSATISEQVTSASGTSTTATPVQPASADAALIVEIEAAISAGPDGCDPLDIRHCYLPYPSDWFTQGDSSTVTGRRVNFPQAGAPANADGVPVDVHEWNRNDGFSPNSTILAYLPGLDAAASALPPWTDLEASLAEDAAVVIVDVDTGARIPLWAEPDSKAPDAADQALVIHPVVALPEGHTFAVGVRALLGADGELLDPGPVFQSYREALTTDIQSIEDRRFAMEEMFTVLQRAGVSRDDLQLAWTFTTASTDDITGRMLHIRDATLAELGDSAPAYAISDVIEPTALDGIARQVAGTYTVPNWLSGDGGPGQRFNTGADGMLAANGTVEAPFVCNIADATMAGDQPARLVQYGHGLLGSHTEIEARNVRDMSNEHNAAYCATKWAGMSEDDIPNAVASLQDLSNFPTLTDRLQQGVLNQVVLGRLMLADDGLIAHPAFRRDDGTPLIDNDVLVFDGNSQGAIMGLMLAGVSPDFERAVLGVPGMNYSMLLPRSVDFDRYEAVFEPAYPNALDRTLLISFVQMLWDRGEGAGYVQHVTTDPLPGTPPKDVLLHVAFGDWQVTELSAMVAARTMGIPIHRPVTADGRSRELEPGWGLDALVYPSPGSGLVVWDSDSDAIPFENLPPRSTRDSHEDPRADVDVRVQKAAFLFDGELVDVCAGQACTADQRD